MYAGQSAEVMLDAIAASDGSRESILEQLFATRSRTASSDRSTFNENGDPLDASGAVVAFTMYKATTEVMESVFTDSPSPEVVQAAQGS